MQKLYPPLCIVNAARIMAQAVADHQIVSPEHAVIGVNLLKNVLRNAYLRSLVLHNDMRHTALAPVYHRIGPASHAAHVYRHLIGRQRSRISLALHEKVRKMLAHPFLRR